MKDEAARLTGKQLLFCQEYVIDLNATQAAIRAGYAESSAAEMGCENLRKPNVEAKINELMELRSKRTEITSDRVLVELSKIGFSNIQQIFGANETLLAPSQYDEDTASAVQSIEVVVRPTYEEDENGNRIVEHVHKIRLADKRGALELMGKHLKLFTEKHEIAGKGGESLIPVINVALGD